MSPWRLPVIADSIRLRLLALAAVWLTVALIAAYGVIGGVLDRFVTSRFDADAAAIADTLIAAMRVDASGHPFVATPPADPRFQLPLAGWFWQIDLAGTPVAKSPSLFDMTLSAPDTALTGAPGLGPDAEALRVLRRGFTLPGVDDALAVTVTVPQAEIDAALHQVRRPLAMSLAVLGIGLALATVVQVSLGLAALDAMGRNIRAVRDGRLTTLPLPRASELRPAAVEMNALIDRNGMLLARARDHLGNLAHSLKTPLAALANTLPEGHDGQALIARMDRQIGWHLRRARSAGGLGQPGLHTRVGPVIDDILTVLQGPLRDRNLSVHVDCPHDARFAGDRQDLEEIFGNLLENAAKWAATRVRVTVRAQPRQVIVLIADDGPGMADADFARALSRGTRLDEAGPEGSGLGLAIVADLAALHGGSLRLDTAPEGGLLAELTLPA